VFAGAIRITSSNTTLDCNGSILDGEGKRAVGIYIDSQGRELSDVTVRNCTLRNFSSNAVRVGWSGPDSAKGDDHDEIYRRTPRRVTLERLTVQATGRVGIYVDDYVSELRLTGSTIENSGGAGIYLEHSSRRNLISGNRIAGNGWTDKREGLAVDSSSQNVIEDNVFARNAAGGVFFYKNCGEHLRGAHANRADQVIRWQHSDRNVLRRNQFLDQPVGIWLASRQSRNRAVSACGDPPLDPQGRYYEDFANDNEVSANTFCRTPVPVRNEGDGNRVVGNRYDATARAAVQMPRTMRDRWAGRPPERNTATDNVTAPCPLQE